MSSSTAVVILCGDVSRRLGVSKALMQVNGNNVIVAILSPQNYHPNACNPWLHYNNARKLFCLFLALLYYFYSEKASRTYLFYKSSRRQLVSFSSFLLFLIL